HVVLGCHDDVRAHNKGLGIDAPRYRTAERLVDRGQVGWSEPCLVLLPTDPGGVGGDRGDIGRCSLGRDEHGAGKAHQNEGDAAYSRCGRPASSYSPCSDHEAEAARTWKLLKVAEVPPWADETQGPARPA